jgi:hypothetical protein
MLFNVLSLLFLKRNKKANTQFNLAAQVKKKVIRKKQQKFHHNETSAMNYFFSYSRNPSYLWNEG